MKLITIAPNHQYSDHSFPQLHVEWSEREDRMGYLGKATLIKADGKRHDHEVSVTMSMPIGSITATVDHCGYGCWSTVSVRSSELSTTDLVWASNWALEALKWYPHDDSPLEQKLIDEQRYSAFLLGLLRASQSPDITDIQRVTIESVLKANAKPAGSGSGGRDE